MQEERARDKAGDEVDVERRPRSGVVLSVRLSPEEADHLQNMAEARRLTLSQIAREAIGRYLQTGPMGGLAGAPWTGTITSLAGLEMIVQAAGPMVRTNGHVQMPEVQRV